MSSYILQELGEEGNRFFLRGEHFDIMEVIFQDQDIVISDTFTKTKLYFVQDLSNKEAGIFTFYSHDNKFFSSFKRQISIIFYTKEKKNGEIPALLWCGYPIFWLFSSQYSLTLTGSS